MYTASGAAIPPYHPGMSSSLSPASFFDLDGLDVGDLFEVEHAWEILGPRLVSWLAPRCARDLRGRVEEGSTVIGDVVLGEGSIIEPGAYVKGPCWIGRDVEVRHGAYVRGHALICDGAVVGHATEVKGSVFLPGAKAGHFAYVGDSILGRNVNLGAGTKLANLRLQGNEVVVQVNGQRVATGLRKFGAILGDEAQTGCNSVTNPGTLLGRGSLLLPCVVASGWHPAGARIRS